MLPPIIFIIKVTLKNSFKAFKDYKINFLY